MLRVDEFMHQTRFADTRGTDNGDDLAVAMAGKFLCTMELLQLGFPADETRQAADGSSLKPCSSRAGADDLVDLDLFGEAFHRQWSERFRGYIAFSEMESVGGRENRARLGHLLHS